MEVFISYNRWNVLSNQSDNKILTWKGPAYGKLVWDELRLPTDYIGTTGSELNIYKSVNVNEYSLELSDTRYVPSIIGDRTWFNFW
jgi:hypothetical protein